MITLSSLTPSTARRKPKRLGRGNASGKGTTAGRGTKGQRARTGGRNKLMRRSLKSLIERTPKHRGFRSLQPKAEVVTLASLQRVFESGSRITPGALHQAGLIRSSRARVKILGGTELKKPLTIQAHAFSKSAAAAITQAGGSAVVIPLSGRPSKTT